MTPALPCSGDGRLRSNVISSQGVHDRFGGVVPEIASRQHLELINLVVEQALSEADMTLEQIGVVALRRARGLWGHCWLGCLPGRLWPRPVSCRSRPVDHLQGHVAANFLDGFEPPFLCLIASGGHTLLVGRNRARGLGGARPYLDDAAARRSTRERRMLGLGIRAAPRWKGSPPRATPRRSPSRARAPSARVAAGGRGGRRLRGASTSPSPG